MLWNEYSQQHSKGSFTDINWSKYVTSSLFATYGRSSSPAVVVLSEECWHLPLKGWQGLQTHGDHCRWWLEGSVMHSYAGAASISTGKLAQKVFLTWGDPAQQCTWSGHVQVSRLCAVPLGVPLDIRIIWHAFKGKKWPRQSCSFSRRIWEEALL